MKRTCWGCRAFYRIATNYAIYNRCTLGYKQKDSAPLEECPKPKTYSDLLKEEGIR